MRCADDPIFEGQVLERVWLKNMMKGHVGMVFLYGRISTRWDIAGFRKAKR